MVSPVRSTPLKCLVSRITGQVDSRIGAGRRGGQPERDAEPAVFSAPGIMGAEIAGGRELRARIGWSRGQGLTSGLSGREAPFRCWRFGAQRGHSRKPLWASASTSSLTNRGLHHPRSIPFPRNNRVRAALASLVLFDQVLAQSNGWDPRTALLACRRFLQARYDRGNANPWRGLVPTPPAHGGLGPNWCSVVFRLRKPPADRSLKLEKAGVQREALRPIYQNYLRTPSCWMV